MFYPSLHSPAFWQSVRENPAYQPLIEYQHRMWEENATGDVPASKYSQFIQFHLTGSRGEYESPYFRRRRGMNAAAILALLYPEKDEYFTKLCDILWAILDEYTWIVPAHMPGFEAVEESYIDLFAAETGASLSEIDAVFADRLPPLIRARIAREVDRRIIQTYLHNHFGWERNTANWAAVCSGSVGIALLYQRPDLIPDVLPRIRQTMAGFLSGFSEDGMCLEGLAYWDYGFGYFMWFSDLLRIHTGGEINLLTDPKVRRIARFPQRVFLDGAASVSFSDSSMTASWGLAPLHFVKRLLPDEVSLPPFEYAFFGDHCGRWATQIRAFLFFDPSLSEDLPPIPGEDYAPDAQWLIRREHAYCFAAKGGANNEPHNHNDIGSFILTKHGKQLLCDPGSGPYNKAYFRAERYTFFRAGSQGHSVPIIHGQYQQVGGEHRASASYENGVFTIDMASAYAVEELRGLKRQFTFTDTTVTLTDTYTFAGEALPVVERFVSRCPAIVDGDVVRIEDLTLYGDSIPTITETEGLWCIDYPVTGETFTLRIDA